MDSTTYPAVPGESCTADHAMPETLDFELAAAQVMTGQPGHHPTQVDLARGVVAALGWAWNNGPLPLVLTD
jgi:hypothetical protein